VAGGRCVSHDPGAYRYVLEVGVGVAGPHRWGGHKDSQGYQRARESPIHRVGEDAGVELSASGLLAARDRLARHLQPSPALRWPLLETHTGTETWVKHENHNPTGAFKVRGGLNFVARTLAERGPVAGLISASRGNHSQSLAYAGRAYGVPVTIVVPEGNSPDKNAATASYGAEVVVHGADFQEALEHAGVLAAERGLLAVPPFHPYLVEGVATYAVELQEAIPDLDVIYVPVGMGSGISANILARDALGRSTEIVGVVAEQAPAYALSFEAGEVVTTPAADTFVDGVACRTPDPAAVEVIVGGAARFVRVSEKQAEEAMALMFRCTHNLAEPAGSLALAGLLAERQQVAGKKVGIIHTGGNADFGVLARALG
jgi:threonine dehydratase